MNKIPEVQLSALLSKWDDAFERFQKELIDGVIYADVRQIGDTHDRYDVPSFQYLSNKTIHDPLDWDHINTFRQSHEQWIESY